MYGSDPVVRCPGRNTQRFSSVVSTGKGVFVVYNDRSYIFQIVNCKFQAWKAVECSRFSPAFGIRDVPL